MSPETVEFRLPDGSAHPHLLLAGIVQAMIAGKEIEDIDALLDQTSVQAQKGTALPCRAASRKWRTNCGSAAPRSRPPASSRAHVIDRTIDALAAACRTASAERDVELTATRSLVHGVTRCRVRAELSSSLEVRSS